MGCVCLFAKIHKRFFFRFFLLGPTAGIPQLNLTDFLFRTSIDSKAVFFFQNVSSMYFKETFLVLPSEKVCIDEFDRRLYLKTNKQRWSNVKNCDKEHRTMAQKFLVNNFKGLTNFYAHVTHISVIYDCFISQTILHKLNKEQSTVKSPWATTF